MKKTFFNIIGYSASLTAALLILFVLIQLFTLKGVYAVLFMESNPVIVAFEIILVTISIIFLSYKIYNEAIIFWEKYYKKK